MLKKFCLLLLFLLGIIFRLWFVNWQVQPLVFDQQEYHDVAKGLMGQSQYIYISAYRMAGYPFILATIYSIFGEKDTFVWKLLQAGMDSMCAIFIFLIARKIFKDKRPGIIAAILYLVNPFTSAFVGVRLTEIITIFAVTLISYLFIFYKKNRHITLFFLLAIILGYLPQVRPGYLFFSIAIYAYLIYDLAIQKIKRKIKATVILFSFVLFSSLFLINMARNKIYFGQYHPMTVDNLFVREFFVSLYVDNFDTVSSIPPEVNWIYQDYSVAKSPEERREKANKYLGFAIREIDRDRANFLVNRVKKLWFVWEKHNLFPYVNPQSSLLPVILKSLYIANLLILGLFLFGIYSFGKKIAKEKSNNEKKWVVGLVIFLIFYISFLHAFTITSERFSLPVYPLIFLFAGYGIWDIIKRLYDSNI